MRRLLVPFLGVLALAVPALAHAAPPPVTWCGSDEVATDRVPSLEPSSPNLVRVLYAVPADGADRFFSLASGIATDATAIDAWWRGQDGARTLRFDRYPFPGCSVRFGDLDLGFVRLPRPASGYLGDPTPAVALDADLAGLSPPATQKTIVYFDGPIRDDRICGETDYGPTMTGGRFGFAYVYLQSGCELGPPGAGETALVAAHELIHNLGAVPDEAPHSCPESPPHVCDSSADIMWTFLGVGETLDVVLLDVNHDDYYAHAGAWWDVQDSAWLVHLPYRRLHVVIEGSGSLAEVPATLECPRGCDVELEDGFQVQLAPVSEPGSLFAGWTGDCGGTAPTCALTMDAPKSVTARFVQVRRLAVSVHGRGRVTSRPAGISCPGRCAGSFASGTAITLAARPVRGYRFAGWSGACRGRGGCVVRLDRDVRVTAAFRRT